MKFAPKRLITLLCGLAFLWLFAGCTHYHLGTGARPDFATLYIAPVKNTADLPQAAAIMSARLREAFLRDGRVTLVESPTSADAVLVVSVDNYQRTTLTANPADTGRARKLGLTLSAAATLTDRRSGRTLFSGRPLVAERQIFNDLGQLQAEYEVVPLLADQVAAAALRATLDVW